MKTETRAYYQHTLRQAVNEIVASIDEAIDLERLARIAALSPFHFHRVFRGMVGETPLELHRRLRMERAAWELAKDDAPVTAVAMRAGYDAHEAFTRAFRLLYGCTPSGYRERSRRGGPTCARSARIELAAPCGVHFRPEPEQQQSIHFMMGGADMEVEVRNMPEIRLAGVRHVGAYMQINRAFERLGEVAGPAGLFGPDSRMVGIFHDDPETTPEAELRSDATITIPDDAEIPPGLTEYTIPAGRYAFTTHVGPYEQLGDAWARLMGRWLPESGNRFGAGMSFEIYLNTPGDVSPDELRTEMYLPIE